MILDQHFYIHLSEFSHFEHVDFAVTTVHSTRPYKFGNDLVIIILHTNY